MILFTSKSKALQNIKISGGLMPVKGSMREAIEITFTGTSYEELMQLFSDGAKYSVKMPDMVDDEGNIILGETSDKSEYCVAGMVADNRDGSFTVRMGAKTPEEIMSDLLNGLVKDKIISAAQKAQIVEERLPKKEEQVPGVEQETGKFVSISVLRPYIEV